MSDERDTEHILSPAVYQALVERNIDLITLLDEKGTVVYASPAIEPRFGYGQDVFVGSCIFDYVHDDDRTLAEQAFADVMAGKERAPLVLRFLHNDGRWRDIEVLGRVHENRGLRGMILNIRDVTNRERLLERLASSEELFRAAFNVTSTICTISELETGQFIDVNDAWVEATGWSREEAIGHTAFELNIWGSPRNRERVVRELSDKGRLRQFPASIRRKDGELRKLLLDAEIIESRGGTRMFISAVDITQRELMEQQLRQSQRMEAVGQLTGGVAHDFNNMLTVILGQLDLVLSDAVDPDELRPALLAVQQAAEHGASLIKQLMVFSRRQTLQQEIIDVSETLHDMETLISGSLGGEIDVVLETRAGDWRCHLDRGLLENAILNLALNARDAMPLGGTLTIRLDDMELDEDGAPDHYVTPGKYVRLQVIDDGEGMSETVSAMAFEPFFTTKPVGRGTGLGLSMVFGFVKQSGGSIEIDSAPGEGTAISILLPLASRADVEEETPEIDGVDISGSRVLLIEDAPELRSVLRQLLESFGCGVLECDGKYVDECLEGVESLDLLLCDVILRGPEQGPQVAAYVRERYPGVRVLFMSGYPRDRLTSEELLGPDDDLLRKPFSRPELAEKLKELFPLQN